MLRRTIMVLIALVFLLAGEAARAEIYMYRDAKGVLNFSNAPVSRSYLPYMPEDTPFRVFSGRIRMADPTRRQKFDPMIRESSRRHRVDPALVKAVIQVESDFVPYARSPKG